MLHELSIRTSAQECLVDITGQVQRVVRESGVTAGTALLYIPHTTCGITIQENADPGVQHDMLMLLRRIAPRDDASYRHIEDNSASHLQASAMGFSQRMAFGRTRLAVSIVIGACRWWCVQMLTISGCSRSGRR